MLTKSKFTSAALATLALAGCLVANAAVPRLTPFSAASALRPDRVRAAGATFA